MLCSFILVRSAYFFENASHIFSTRTNVSVLCTMLIALVMISCPVHAQLTWSVNPDEFKDLHVPTYVWTSQQYPKAIILGIHGGCLDGNTFKPISEILNTHGYSVDAVKVLTNPSAKLDIRRYLKNRLAIDSAVAIVTSKSLLMTQNTRDTIWTAST